MELIRVDKELCRRDGICMEACPVGCIKADAEGYPVAANEAACFACGHCVAICPHGAMENTRLPMDGFTPAPRDKASFAALSGLMKSRRSVREFKDQSVPPATLAELLDVARFAPTARHTQQVGYIVTADPAKTNSLAGEVLAWMRTVPALAGYLKLAEGVHNFALRGAPHVVIALGDADNDWAEVDCAIALSYLELAAAAHGLGVCWAGLLHRAVNASPALAASLGIPEGRKVGAALMLGVPKYRYALVPPRNPAPVVLL